MMITRSQTKQMETDMSDFKKHVIELKPINTNMMEYCRLRHMGVFLMTQVIPHMKDAGDVAFGWSFDDEDIGELNQKEYDREIVRYRKLKMKVDRGNTTWFYDFKKNGKMSRCIMTTEIWYCPKQEMDVSPIAMLFNQYMAEGLHITKCQFKDI